MLEKWRTKRCSHQIGAIVEQKARRWLQQRGLQLIASNYHCTAGEIDIIMRDDTHLVFVEVRYRSKNSFGDGLESVDARKQNKLHKAAACYLLENAALNFLPCRFDVMAAKPDNHTGLHWTWIKDAFTT